MKLFTQYNRVNLLAIVALFLLSGVCYFFLIRFVFVSQVDEDLRIERHEILSYLSKHGALPEIIPAKDQMTRYSLSTEFYNESEKLSSVKAAEKPHEHLEEYRQIQFFAKVGSATYKITVAKSLEGTDLLIRTILGVTLLTIVLVLLVTLFINRILLQRLWRPFNETLEKLTSFNLEKKQHPNFSTVSIEEFQQLNDALNKMTKKVVEDYDYLKEFTENASHEMQTPLAVIRAKMDMLIADEKLSPRQYEAVQGAYNSVERLSRLSQSLLLITKIENGQFSVTTLVNLEAKLLEKESQFQEMAEMKQIRMSVKSEPVTKQINPMLVDIIFGNMFSNAIRHTQEGGDFEVLCTNDGICFSNTAANVPLDQSKLFRRFSQQNTQNQGLGLGLAIVKQAADASGISINYTFSEQKHSFTLSFVT